MSQHTSVRLVTTRRRGLSGQSLFERHLADALGVELPGVISSTTVGGLRTRGADVRLPTRLQRELPFRARRALGSLIYRGQGLVHRLDLGAPPARGEILTVHDLAPLHFADEGFLPKDAKDSIRAAAAVVTASTFAAAEIRAHTGRDDIEVIAHGVDPFLAATPAMDASARRALGIGDCFVLHAGGATARKNVHGLMAGWKLVSADHTGVELVLCGPPSEVRSAAIAGVARARYLGAVPREVLVGLMKSASAVAVPSKYEGFGLPALEAMACGVPVVASRRAAFEEICGDDAILVEPTGEGLAAGLARALVRDEGVSAMVARAARRASTFTWDRAAQQYALLYRSVTTTTVS